MMDIGAFGSLSDGCVFADCPMMGMGETLAIEEKAISPKTDRYLELQIKYLIFLLPMLLFH